MSKSLDDLQPQFREKAFELLARIVEAGIPITIVDTLRTPEEHAVNLANGTSWIKRSKHMDGLAIDLAPTPLMREKNWAPGHVWWRAIGAIGKNLGLTWGGDWTKKDMGHFEWR